MEHRICRKNTVECFYIIRIHAISRKPMLTSRNKYLISPWSVSSFPSSESGYRQGGLIALPVCKHVMIFFWVSGNRLITVRWMLYVVTNNSRELLHQVQPWWLGLAHNSPFHWRCLNSDPNPSFNWECRQVSHFVMSVIELLLFLLERLFLLTHCRQIMPFWNKLTQCLWDIWPNSSPHLQFWRTESAPWQGSTSLCNH